jgi:hypothetical protein
MLTGTIPTTIGNCPSLEYLGLNSNGLVGPLPSEIFSPSLEALGYLILDNNELTGRIPDNYGQLPGLLALALNDNKLSGTLPAIAEGEFPNLSKYLAQDMSSYYIRI